MAFAGGGAVLFTAFGLLQWRLMRRLRRNPRV